MSASSAPAARFARFAAIVALSLLLAGTAASAGDWKSKWSGGHKIESEDGQFKLKFGGRLMADWTLADPDSEIEAAFGPVEDGSEFRRARLFFSGTIYGNVEFKVNYDFAGGDADFKDTWLAFKESPVGKIKIGHFKEAFGLEELTSSKYIAFAERSLSNVFAPSRNTGFEISDKKGDKLNWAIGAFRESDGFGDSEGDGKLNITGRIAGRPVYKDEGKQMIHLGLGYTRKDLGDDSFRIRQRPEAHQTPRFVDTSSFAADSLSIIGLEFAAVSGPFWTAAEYMMADADASALGDPSFGGFNIQAGYYFTGEHRRFKTSSGVWDRTKPKKNFGDGDGRGAWELAGRYSTLDLTDEAITGGEIDNFTVALNWYPNPATRMMLNFIQSDVKNVGDASFVVVRWQVDF